MCFIKAFMKRQRHCRTSARDSRNEDDQGPALLKEFADHLVALDVLFPKASCLHDTKQDALQLCLQVTVSISVSNGTSTPPSASQPTCETPSMLPSTRRFLSSMATLTACVGSTRLSAGSEAEQLAGVHVKGVLHLVMGKLGHSQHTANEIAG